MASASIELQTAIYERLTAESGVSAIVAGRVYDNVPEGPTFPYISFGPSDYYPDDADDIDGRVETLQIDCWTRAQGKKRPARELADAVKKALHQFEASFATNALVEIVVTSVRVINDPDPLTAHGIVTVTATIEEH